LSFEGGARSGNQKKKRGGDGGKNKKTLGPSSPLFERKQRENSPKGDTEGGLYFPTERRWGSKVNIPIGCPKKKKRRDRTPFPKEECVPMGKKGRGGISELYRTRRGERNDHLSPADRCVQKKEGREQVPAS